MTQPTGQPAGPDSAPDRDWLERYEPLRQLGTEYWTRSLLCRDRQSGSQVVVREIRPAIWWHAAERHRALEALRREAEALARLGQTPGGSTFPALLETAVEGEFPWIAIEYLQGSTLRDRFPLGPDGQIPSESGWTLTETLHAFASLCDGLRVLHRLGLAHGLIHPKCLALEETGHPDAGTWPRLRLRSLGWAAAPKEQEALPDREAVPYLDPYGLRCASPPGPEADAWSVAAILFELVAGRPAFGGDPTGFEHEERFAVRRRMTRGLPPGLPAQLPPELLAFLKSTLAVPESVRSREAGGEPLGGFFVDLARLLEVVQRDELWSQARLPNPDLERLRREIRARRPPVSTALLEAHEMAWGRWRSATRQAIEALSQVKDLAVSEPWSAWRREIDEDAVACLQSEPKDDPHRDDSEALAARVQQIERRVAALDQICNDAWQLLRERVRGVVEELEAAVRQSEGALQRENPTLVETIGAFRRELERFSGDRITPDLFPFAARLSGEGEDLRQRTRQVAAAIVKERETQKERGELLQRRQDAQVGFFQEVRGKDFNKARTVLKSWPGGVDDTGRLLSEGLDAWQDIEQEAVALLASPRTPQALASMRQVAGKLSAAPPAGFETLVRPLARQLEEALEAPRSAARAAVEGARAYCAEQKESAARAAERSQIERLPDRSAASSFCRALQALERAVEDATRDLSATAENLDALMGLPAAIRGLEDRAKQARQTWWPADNLPRPQSEWVAFVENVNRLRTRGRSGIQTAHRLREKQAPAGWEELARALVLPEIPPPDWRRWIPLAAAATVVVGIGLVWMSWGHKGDSSQGMQKQEAAPTATSQRVIPTPPPEDDVATPTLRDQEVLPPPETAWVHGPAFAMLHLEIDGRESASIQLPAVVPFPGKTPVTLWLSSGQNHTRKIQTTGETDALQRSVDALAAELENVPANVQAVDAEIALRVRDLMQREER